MKNVHLSSNSYNFWMQPNIAMKCMWPESSSISTVNLAKNFFYTSTDIEFLLGGGLHFWCTLYINDRLLVPWNWAYCLLMFIDFVAQICDSMITFYSIKWQQWFQITKKLNVDEQKIWICDNTNWWHENACLKN